MNEAMAINTTHAQADSPDYLHLQNIREDHFILPTWMLISFLVVIFIILKTFIYISDDKRKNR